jgi:3-oxoacyl-[acyl-carrier protein] reductase
MGVRVVVNYVHNQSEAEKTAEAIGALGQEKPVLLQFDVANSDAVEKGFDFIEKEFGGTDILVNNAGLAIDKLTMRCKDEDWHQQINVNLGGAFFCARTASKQMLKKRWGRIVNLSSVVGESGGVAGQVAYASAKAGVIGLTKTLARELASRQITVNAVTPGLIATDMTGHFSAERRAAYLEMIPLGFEGTPDDVASAVAFLVSEQARYITGHVLAVNGGMYM